jgi:hypothetical protein
VDAKGEVWRLAGTPGQPGHVDNKATEARFHHPAAVVFRPDGGLLVSDRDNRCIRLVKDGVTDTVAGCSYHALWQDGTGAQAGFLAPGALALDPRTGNLFICDQHRVRFMDPEGGVRTAAGSLEEGFEAWRRNPPTTHGLTRMAGIPCLSHPSALEVDAACDSLRIVDAGNRASRALAIAPGPFQGDLTTLSTQGRAVQAAPDEGIVLELRDLDRFKDRFDRGIQDELKAAGFRTGLSFRDGAGLGRTRGLRLVLFEGCRGVATCHPID